MIAATKRLGDRVDREVALREVGLDRLAADRQDVDLPAAIAGDHPPHAERVRQRERVRVSVPRERAREFARVAGDRDVVVVGRAPEDPVADGPAHQPGRVQRDPGERVERIAGGQTGVPSRWYSLGTRGVSPHRTS